jgi:small subunit ribosomal protein S6
MAEAQKAALPLREYESIYVLKPDLAKATLEKVAGRVEDVIGREGGKLTLVENWGRRALAYKVQKYTRGVYVYVKYLGDGKTVSELERNFRLLDEVMKFQTVKVADGINAADVTIDAEAVKFEAHEPPSADEEPELTLEQQLGLVEGAKLPREERDDYGDDFDQEDDE